MAKYILTTWQIHEIGGGMETSVINLGGPATPRREIDAANIKDIEIAFDAFAAELKGAGACYRVSVRKDRRCAARKFNGFEKATNHGGRLRIVVNPEIAEAAYNENPFNRRRTA